MLNNSLFFSFIFGVGIFSFSTKIGVEEWLVLIDFEVSAKKGFLSVHNFDILVNKLFNFLIGRYSIFMFIFVKWRLIGDISWGT